MRFDRVARHLLALVQRNSRRSLDRLAHAVGSSRSAVQRRMELFRRTGVIKRDVALVDRRLVSRMETFIIHLELRCERRHLLDQFRAIVDDLPQVQQCYVTTGRLNCVAVVLLPNADELDAFVVEHFSDSPFVRRYRTRLVTRELKASLAVPVLSRDECS